MANITELVRKMFRTEQKISINSNPLPDRTESKVAQIEPYGFYNDQEKPEEDEDYLEAFNVHPWLFACVRIIAQNCAKLPVKVYKKMPDGSREELKAGWPVDVLASPNRWTSAYRLKYGISAFMTLTGDAFLEKNHITTPTNLWLLQPSKIKIDKGAKKKIQSYTYEVNARQIIFQPEEIIQFSAFNPLSEYFGTSCVSPLQASLTIDFYAQAFEKAFFRNGGHMGGVFSTPKDLDNDLFARLKSVIQEALNGSGKNHKSLFLDNDVKYTKMSVDPKEADLKPIRDFNIREVCAVLGVPRMLVQDSAETAYANAEAQLKIFWGETMIPHCTMISDTFNQQLYNPHGLECEFDFTGVEALRESESFKIDIANKKVSGGIFTINEVRKDMFKKDPVPWGDEPAQVGAGEGEGVPGDIVPARAPATAETGLVAAPQAPVGGKAVPPLELGVEALKQILTINEARASVGLGPVDWGNMTLAEKEAKDNMEVDGEPVKSMPLAKRAKLPHGGIRKGLRDRYEKRLYKLVADYMKGQADAIQENIKTITNTGKVKKAAIGGAEILLGQLTKGQLNLIEKINKLTQEASQKFHSYSYAKNFKTAKVPEFLNQTRQEFLSNYVGQMVKGFDETSIGKLQGIITKGLEQQKSVEEIGFDLQESLKKQALSTGRAMNIARTETHRLENYGMLQSFYDAGAPYKMWVALGPPDDREWHTSLDMTVQKVDEPFIVITPEGEQYEMQFPGDPAGEAVNVCNCRCYLEPVHNLDDLG